MKCFHTNTVSVFNMSPDASQLMFDEDQPAHLIVPVILTMTGRPFREAESSD